MIGKIFRKPPNEVEEEVQEELVLGIKNTGRKLTAEDIRKLQEEEFCKKYNVRKKTEYEFL